MSLHLSPIEIDARRCGLCGLRVDRHQMIDDGEGPEFFCLAPEEMTLPELERRAALIRDIEVAEIFARLEAMDDPTARVPPPREPEPYRTPQSTIDAFWFVVGLADPDKFKAWMLNHPKDAATLLKLLESK